MHIGLLLYGSLDTVSGGYLYDRQLVQALQSAGHTLEIVALPWRTYARHLLDNWSSALWHQLRTAPFDLLVQDELNHPSLAWLNGRLRAQVRYPVITIVHHLRSSEIHPRPLLPFYRWVERCYLQSVDGLVYNSATTRATVLALAATHKPSIIAYPAADHRRPPDTAETLVRVAAQANSLEPLQILFVGNVIARKGLHQLLAALALLPRAQWRLAVVGSLTTDPGYVAQIRRMLVALDLLPNVVLHGACSDDALRGFYAQSALFAAPAYEGFGIAYLEAMSFGLPVIAATAGAAHEIVTHGIDGYLVAADDRAGLAASIARFCQDRLLLATMGQAARQRYDRHPTWQASFTPVVQWLQAQVV